MTKITHYFCDDFANIVKEQPNAIALVINDNLEQYEVTYCELLFKIKQCIRLFENQGLKPGDTIATLLPNALETVIVFLATLAGGFGFAPQPCTSTPNEIKRWDRLIKPKIWFWSDLLTETTKNSLDKLITNKIKISTDKNLEWLPEQSSRWPDIKSAQYCRIYLQTSGTTGEPKAMVIDGNRLWSSGLYFINWHNITEQSLRFWNYLPMSYLGGLFNLTLIPLACKGSTVIDQAFSGKTFLGYWQTIKRFNINTIWLVPSIVRGLLQLATLTKQPKALSIHSEIKVAFLGTAPIDLSTKTEFEQQFGLSLLENFALSETTFFSSEHCSDDKSIRTEGSTGRVLPYIELSFKNLNDDEFPEQSKEILVKSPFNFIGYLDQDGKVNNPFDENGFFPTGDIGYINNNNQLVINGRRRDIIKKGGYLIYLREIEAFLQSNIDISEVAAVKINHPFYGEAYNLFISPQKNKNLDLIELEKWIHKELVQYKWPESVHLVDELPKTASGKILKHKLLDVKE